jgi:MFS family permease
MSFAQPITPSTENGNFRHLVMDIAFYGLALGAYGRFLTVYAIHLGATPLEQGLLSSLPALVLLLFSSIGAWWTRRFSDPGRALVIPAIVFRTVFILPAFAPFFPPQWQPLYLILCVSLPAVMQGASGTSFLMLMRASVSDTRMTQLLSKRSLALNIGVGIGALAFGVWLRNVAFPLNYQLMFGLAFVFAMMSLRECTKVRILNPLPASPKQDPSSNPWRSSGFKQLAMVTIIIHIAYFSVLAVIPLYLTKVLHADEVFIAVFGIVELAAGALTGAMTPRIVQKIGNRAMIAGAMLATAIAAIIIAIAPNLWLTLIGSALAGGAWTAAASVGLWGYFNQTTPMEHMTTYSTAFHQVIGLSVFIGPLVGSLLANSGMNLVAVLMIGAALRLVAAPLIEYPELLRWGSRRRSFHMRGVKP